MRKLSVIKTYSDEIYFIKEKTPEEILAGVQGSDVMLMPNGDIIKTANIRSIVSHDSYMFQVDQKERHKKGQHISGNMWRDDRGREVIRDRYLDQLTGDVRLLQEKVTKQLPEQHAD